MNHSEQQCAERDLSTGETAAESAEMTTHVGSEIPVVPQVQEEDLSKSEVRTLRSEVIGGCCVFTSRDAEGNRRPDEECERLAERLFRIIDQQPPDVRLRIYDEMSEAFSQLANGLFRNAVDFFTTCALRFASREPTQMDTVCFSVLIRSAREISDEAVEQRAQRLQGDVAQALVPVYWDQAQNNEMLVHDLGQTPAEVRVEIYRQMLSLLRGMSAQRGSFLDWVHFLGRTAIQFSFMEGSRDRNLRPFRALVDGMIASTRSLEERGVNDTMHPDERLSHLFHYVCGTYYDISHEFLERCGEVLERYALATRRHVYGTLMTSLFRNMSSREDTLLTGAAMHSFEARWDRVLEILREIRDHR